jgi:hypothetical protein
VTVGLGAAMTTRCWLSGKGEMRGHGGHWTRLAPGKPAPRYRGPGLDAGEVRFAPQYPPSGPNSVSG